MSEYGKSQPAGANRPSADRAAQDWDARYARAATEGGLWAEQPPRVLQQYIGRLSPGTALDLATGDGRLAVWLARSGWATTGVDFSSEALQIARRRPYGETVQWVQADARTWEPGQTFDLVVVAYLHLVEIADVLRRVSSWVAPRGTLLVLGHDVENIAFGGHGPRNPAVLYSPELLREALEPALVVHSAERFERGVDDAESRDDEGLVSIDTFAVARARTRART